LLAAIVPNFLKSEISYLDQINKKGRFVVRLA
jgi:hypothetical protein